MPLGRIENWIKHIFTSIKIMIFHGKQLKHDFIRFHSDTERAKREKKNMEDITLYGHWAQSNLIRYVCYF